MSDRALWAQAQQDYTQALAIANLAWAARGDADAAAIQSATATILIHVTKLRERGGVTPQPAAAAPTSGGKSPQGAAVGIPPCPQCGGEMWDNRGKKKNPKSADFTCKQKNGEYMSKGYKTGVWLKDAAKVAVAAGIRDQIDEGYAVMPKALQEDDGDDLPF